MSNETVSLLLAAVGTAAAVIGVVFQWLQLRGAIGGGDGNINNSWISPVLGLVLSSLVLLLAVASLVSLYTAPSRAEMLRSAMPEVEAQVVMRHDLPVHVPQALIAVHDPAFYSRRLAVGPFSGSSSSITEMLADELNTSNARGVIRQVQNTFLGLWIQRHFSRDEILWLYVNCARFGSARGIASATGLLFQKEPADLSLTEAAQVVAVLNSNTARTEELRSEAEAGSRVVLYEMHAMGFIGELEVEDPSTSADELWPRWTSREAVTSTTTNAAEYVAFSEARRSNEISGYERYLAQFPNGRYAEVASSSIQQLRTIHVRVCNHSGRTVFAVISLQPSGNRTWRTRGWYRVTNNRCRTIATTETPRFYLFAESGQFRWGNGNAWLCVSRPRAFDIESSGHRCSNEGERVSFLEVSHQSGTYTWNLSP